MRLALRLGCLLLLVPFTAMHAQTAMPAHRNAADFGSVESAIASAGKDGVTEVPPNYSGKDVPAGSRTTNVLAPSSSVQPDGAQVIDYRFGAFAHSVFNPGANNKGNFRPWRQFVSNYTQALTDATGINRVGNYFHQNAFDGGFNFNENGYTNKTNWVNGYWQLNRYALGQGFGGQSQAYCYGNGDCIGWASGAVSWGGVVNGSDEGVQAMTGAMSQGYTAYTGTITAGGTAGSTSLTLNPTAGRGTQGPGRYALNLSQSSTTGVVTTIAGGSGGPVIYTGSGTNWGTSTTTTTTTAITVAAGQGAPGTMTVTVGSTAGMTTSSLVCVASPGDYETVKPSAVNDGTHFTASFYKPHAAGATVAWGGECGKFVELTADRWTQTGRIAYWTVENTLRRAYPVIASTATTLQVWIVTGDHYDNYIGQATTTGGSNAYALYPGAEVYSVVSNGGVNNVLTVAPNAVNWRPGDTVEVPPYPQLIMTWGNYQAVRFFPSPASGSGGMVYTYSGVWQGQDTLLGLRNNTAQTQYQGFGGNLQPPYSMRMIGLYNYGLRYETAPLSAALSLGCPAAGCLSDRDTVVASTDNGTGFDLVQYNGARKRWIITTGNRAKRYVFAPEALVPEPPGTNLGSGNSAWGTVYANAIEGNAAAQFTAAPVAPPAHDNSTCKPGQWAQDNKYFYVCHAPNSWHRVAWDTAKW